MSLSCAFFASASSAKSLVFDCPAVPMRPKWTVCCLPFSSIFQNFLDVPPNGLVAFAGPRLEAALIDDLDVPAVIADEARLLQHIGDDSHGRAAHAEHLR